MTEQFRLGDIIVSVERKAVRNVHLSVHPPAGRVTLVAPESTRLDLARAYAITKLGWIREQQASFERQERETARKLVPRETHQVWGRHHLLQVCYSERKPSVVLEHRRITLTVRHGAELVTRQRVLNEWHLSLLHEAVLPLIAYWQRKLKVSVYGYFLQRMKTKWGSCNPTVRHIRLNTQLVRKPKDLLEYVIVHEMAHLIEPTHNQRFICLLNKHYPQWQEARKELNALPLTAECWPKYGI